MRKFILILLFFVSVSSVRAQFMYVGDKSDPFKTYFALFMSSDADMIMYYNRGDSKSFEPVKCVKVGTVDMLGKTLIKFQSAMYNGGFFYVNFSKGLLSFDLFDDKLQPVGTFFNDSKAYKGNISLK